MNTEQQTNLKFLVWLGKTLTEALRLLQDVYGDGMMSRARAFKWHRRWRKGRMSKMTPEAGDLPQGGPKKMSSLFTRRCMVGDRRLTVRMIANELDMNCERVWTIIVMKDLGMRKICAKMVLKLLKEKQEEQRVQVCYDILEQLKTELNLLEHR